MRMIGRTVNGNRGVPSWLAVAGIALTLAGCFQPTSPSARARAGANRRESKQESPARELAAGKTVESVLSAQELYSRHCGACHGEQGDGKGIAAVYLFPKPRDFTSGRFRLVSTDNSVPSRDDVLAVLTRGMPGSSMPSWTHLPQADREKLAEHVLRLLADGARARYIKALQEQEGMSDEDLQQAETQADIEQFVKSKTTAGALSNVPKLVDADAAAVARGRELYTRQSCHSCHGNEGKGDGVQKMIDDDGMPTRPRDLTRGIFKGGHDVASLYRRVAFGMPGTPMPNSPNLQPDQIVDLAHFLRSLSTEASRQAAIISRRQLTAVRVKKLPREGDATEWDKVPATAIAVIPLWWRDDAAIEAQLQCAHDGKDLAIRLTWPDSTQSDSAVYPDEFEDMAAVQLFHGANEPFLGMGASDAKLDLWQWRGGASRHVGDLSQLDEYPFDTPAYDKFLRGAPAPDFLTARVAGNPLTGREPGGSSLTASGLGSVTFRPKASQMVHASGRWSDGGWRVELRRPLVVNEEDGLTLAAGSSYSIALAIWDGAFHDRASQKQISIWNDLRVE